MWNKITGKSSDSSSHDGRRKGESSSSRRRAESIVSSSASRNPPRQDDRSQYPASRNSYPPPGAPSVASSYATAPSERSRAPDSTTYSSPSRSRSGYDDRFRERDEGKMDRKEKRDKSSKKSHRDRDSGRLDEGGYSEDRGLERAVEPSAYGNGSFSAQVGRPGFTQFPGQSGAPLVGSSSSYYQESMSAHVADQFPGQNPATFSAPYRPPLSVNEGGPGLAADYYFPESVAYQPGVRPQAPSLIVGAQPHLMAASAAPAPPIETGHSSTQNHYQPSGHQQSMPGSFGEPSPPTKPPRPQSSKPSKSSDSGQPTKMSTATALAGGLAAGYAMGHHKTHGTENAQSIQTSTSSYQQGSTIPLSSVYHGHSSSAPVVPTVSTYSSSSTRPGKHGKDSSRPSNTNLPAYAAGAAGLAAGAYALHNSHSSHHHSAATPAAGTYPNSTLYAPSPSPYAHGMTAMKHRHRGPIAKFVDWWKDYEDVRRMEEYTEYIGVCRDCFDPRSSLQDAPRKHHYHRRRSGEARRSGEHRTGRVDKESRYYSSDNEARRKNRSSWIATGLAGYGLTKVGKAMWSSNSAFDDTYSVKSGREHRSNTSLVSRSRSRSRDRRSQTSRGVVRRRSRSKERIATGTSRDRKVVYKTDSRRSRSRTQSRSRDRKNVLLGASIGTATAASATGRAHSKHHSRSRSPRHEYVQVRHRNTEHSPSKAHQSSRHSVTSPTRSDRSRRRQSQNTGLLGGFFASGSERRRRTHAKKKKGFFTFGNSSSSSSDSGLIYGTSAETRRRSKRKTSDEKLNAALLGLGATAAALAAAQHGRSKHLVHKPEVVAVRERRHRRERASQRPRRSSVSSSSTSSHDEGAWVDESEVEDDSLSVSSGLAFGDFDLKGKSAARKSQESLVSDTSGTGKWGWRWGSKTKRKPSVPQASGSGSFIGPAAAGLVGAAAGAALVERNESATSSHSSVPTMQTVYPVPTSDPHSFDAIRRTASFSSNHTHPVLTSRPEPVPLQQPQPIAPVSNAVYTTQVPYQPAYVAPTGPPVFSTGPPNPSMPQTYPEPRQVPGSFSPASRDLVNLAEYPSQRPPLANRRGASSPVLRNFVRDATMVGIAAGVTAEEVRTGHGRAQSQSSPSNVRFDLTREQAEKGYRERQRQQDEEIRRRERQRREDEEAKEAERQRLATVEAEDRKSKRLEREDLARRARERQEAEKLEHRTQLARQEAERETEVDRDAKQISREREIAAREAAAREAAAREEAERLRKEHETARLKREHLEREIYEQEQQEQARAEFERQRRRREAELEREIEIKERELREREPPLPAAAAVGAIAGAVIAKAVDKGASKEEDNHPEIRYVVPIQKDDDDFMDDDEIFDPDYFIKSRERSNSYNERQAELARKAASKVIADLEEKYKEEPQSMAAFFAPPELLTGAGAVPSFNANGDIDVSIYPMINVGVPRAPPYPPAYAFTTTKDGVSGPSPMPSLNLIPATPPISIAGSVKGDLSAPGSPVVLLQDTKATPQVEEEPEKPQPSRVTWGEPETIHYEAQTPEVSREQFVADLDLLAERDERGPQTQDEIVVEVESPGSGTTKASYRPEAEHEDTQEKAREPEVPLSRKQRKEEDKAAKHKFVDTLSSIVEPSQEAGSPEIESPMDETPIYRSVSPEREAVVITPNSDVPGRGSYHNPFFETISDLGIDVDSGTVPSHPGFVEGELFGDTPTLEKEIVMPGGFIEEPETSPAPEPVWDPPLSKKEKKKRDKAAKGQSWDEAFLPQPGAASTSEAPVEATGVFAGTMQEPGFEVPLSKKERKKRDKAAKTKNFDEEPSPVPRSPGSPAAEAKRFEVPLSKKERKKLDKKATKRAVLEGDDPSTSGSPAAHADDRPDFLSGIAGPAAAGILAGAGDEAIGANGERKRDDDRSSASTETPRRVVSGHSSPRTAAEEPVHAEDERRVLIPSNAFDDIQELAEVKKPQKKAKRRSGRFSSPTPGSPLRTEVSYDDYVGADVTLAVDKNNWSGVEDVESAAAVPLPEPGYDELTVDDSGDISRRSVPDISQSTPIGEEQARHQRAASEEYNELKQNKGKKGKRTGPKYEELERSTSSVEAAPEPTFDRQLEPQEATFDDFEEPKKSKSKKSKRRSEAEVGRPSASPNRDDRSTVSVYPLEAAEDRKKPEHQGRESDKYDKSLSVGSGARYDEDDVDDDWTKSKHRKSSRKDSDPYESPERYARSTAASEPGDLYESSRKSSKRKSKRGDDFDDASSVVSSPARYNEGEINGKTKKEKKGGLFGLFSSRKPSDSLPELSKSETGDEERDGDKKRRHKSKHRDRESPLGSDEEDDRQSQRSSTSNAKGKRKGSDEAGMDTRDQATKDNDLTDAKDRFVEDDGKKSFLGERAEDDLPPLPVSPPLSPTGAAQMERPHKEAHESPHAFLTNPNEFLEAASAPINQPATSVDSDPIRGLPPLPDSQPASPIEADLNAGPSERKDEATTLPSYADLTIGATTLPTDTELTPSTMANLDHAVEMPASQATQLHMQLETLDSTPFQPLKTGIFDQAEALPSLPDSRPTTPLDVGRAEDLPSLPASRPSSPLEVGRAADLPALPPSRPNSPYRRDEIARPSLTTSRAASTTAVPLRFRKPPSSPGVTRDMTIGSPSAHSPSSPLSAPRLRHTKSNSAEYKINTQEFRPLYLVERNRKTPEVEEFLPPLPSSRTTSRSPSVQGTEGGYQSALASPEDSFHDADDVFDSSFAAYDRHSHDDYLDSQQPTPKAAQFPAHVLDLPREEEERPVAPAMFEGDGQALRNEAQDLEKRSILGDNSQPVERVSSPPHSPRPIVEAVEGNFPHQLRSRSARPLVDVEDLPALPLSRPSSPYEAEDHAPQLLENAEAAAVVGVVVGAAAALGLTAREEKDVESDFMGGETAEANLPPETPHSTSPPEPANTTAQEARSPVLTPTSSKKGKKEKKSIRGSKPGSSSDLPSTPVELSPEEQRQLRERDAQDAVDSWFEPAATFGHRTGKKGKKGKGSISESPIAVAVPAGEKSAEASSDILESSVPPPLQPPSSQSDVVQTQSPQPTPTDEPIETNGQASQHETSDPTSIETSQSEKSIGAELPQSAPPSNVLLRREKSKGKSKKKSKNGSKPSTLVKEELTSEVVAPEPASIIESETQEPQSTIKSPSPLLKGESETVSALDIGPQALDPELPVVGLPTPGIEEPEPVVHENAWEETGMPEFPARNHDRFTDSPNTTSPMLKDESKEVTETSTAEPTTGETTATKPSLSRKKSKGKKKQRFDIWSDVPSEASTTASEAENMPSSTAELPINNDVVDRKMESLSSQTETKGAFTEEGIPETLSTSKILAAPSKNVDEDPSKQIYPVSINTQGVEESSRNLEKDDSIPPKAIEVSPSITENNIIDEPQLIETKSKGKKNKKGKRIPLGKGVPVFSPVSESQEPSPEVGVVSEAILDQSSKEPKDKERKKKQEDPWADSEADSATPNFEAEPVVHDKTSEPQEDVEPTIDDQVVSPSAVPLPEDDDDFVQPIVLTPSHPASDVDEEPEPTKQDHLEQNERPELIPLPVDVGDEFEYKSDEVTQDKETPEPGRESIVAEGIDTDANPQFLDNVQPDLKLGKTAIPRSDDGVVDAEESGARPTSADKHPDEEPYLPYTVNEDVQAHGQEQPDMWPELPERIPLPDDADRDLEVDMSEGPMAQEAFATIMPDVPIERPAEFMPSELPANEEYQQHAATIPDSAETASVDTPEPILLESSSAQKAGEEVLKTALPTASGEGKSRDHNTTTEAPEVNESEPGETVIEASPSEQTHSLAEGILNVLGFGKKKGKKGKDQASTTDRTEPTAPESHSLAEGNGVTEGAPAAGQPPSETNAEDEWAIPSKKQKGKKGKKRTPATQSPAPEVLEAESVPLPETPLERSASPIANAAGSEAFDKAEQTEVATSAKQGQEQLENDEWAIPIKKKGKKGKKVPARQSSASQTTPDRKELLSSILPEEPKVAQATTSSEQKDLQTRPEIKADSRSLPESNLQSFEVPPTPAEEDEWGPSSKKKGKKNKEASGVHTPASALVEPEAVPLPETPLAEISAPSLRAAGQTFLHDNTSAVLIDSSTGGPLQPPMTETMILPEQAQQAPSDADGKADPTSGISQEVIEAGGIPLPSPTLGDLDELADVVVYDTPIALDEREDGTSTVISGEQTASKSAHSQAVLQAPSLAHGSDAPSDLQLSEAEALEPETQKGDSTSIPVETSEKDIEAGRSSPSPAARESEEVKVETTGTAILDGAPTKIQDLDRDPANQDKDKAEEAIVAEAVVRTPLEVDVEDLWDDATKKKGKKGKKRKQLPLSDTSSTTNDLEQTNDKPDNIQLVGLVSQSTLPRDEQVPPHTTELSQGADVEDPWTSTSNKRNKKGKKGKRLSMPSTPPVIEGDRVVQALPSMKSIPGVHVGKGVEEDPTASFTIEISPEDAATSQALTPANDMEEGQQGRRPSSVLDRSLEPDVAQDSHSFTGASNEPSAEIPDLRRATEGPATVEGTTTNILVSEPEPSHETTQQIDTSKHDPEAVEQAEGFTELDSRLGDQRLKNSEATTIPKAELDLEKPEDVMVQFLTAREGEIKTATARQPSALPSATLDSTAKQISQFTEPTEELQTPGADQPEIFATPAVERDPPFENPGVEYQEPVDYGYAETPGVDRDIFATPAETPAKEIMLDIYPSLGVSAQDPVIRIHTAPVTARRPVIRIAPPYSASTYMSAESPEAAPTQSMQSDSKESKQDEANVQKSEPQYEEAKSQEDDVWAYFPAKKGKKDKRKSKKASSTTSGSATPVETSNGTAYNSRQTLETSDAGADDNNKDPLISRVGESEPVEEDQEFSIKKSKKEKKKAKQVRSTKVAADMPTQQPVTSNDAEAGLEDHTSHNELQREAELLADDFDTAKHIPLPETPKSAGSEDELILKKTRIDDEKVKAVTTDRASGDLTASPQSPAVEPGTADRPLDTANVQDSSSAFLMGDSQTDKAPQTNEDTKPTETVEELWSLKPSKKDKRKAKKNKEILLEPPKEAGQILQGSGLPKAESVSLDTDDKVTSEPIAERLVYETGSLSVEGSPIPEGRQEQSDGPQSRKDKKKREKDRDIATSGVVVPSERSTDRMRGLDESQRELSDKNNTLQHSGSAHIMPIPPTHDAIDEITIPSTSSSAVDEAAAIPLPDDDDSLEDVTPQQPPSRALGISQAGYPSVPSKDTIDVGLAGRPLDHHPRQDDPQPIVEPLKRVATLKQSMALNDQALPAVSAENALDPSALAPPKTNARDDLALSPAGLANKTNDRAQVLSPPAGPIGGQLFDASDELITLHQHISKSEDIREEAIKQNAINADVIDPSSVPLPDEDSLSDVDTLEDRNFTKVEHERTDQLSQLAIESPNHSRIQHTRDLDRGVESVFNGHHLEPETPAPDLDFAATLAAGLTGSGFDPNIVIKDPVFHRRTSPLGAVAEANPEEVFKTITKKSKKGKKSKQNHTPSTPVSRDPVTPVEPQREIIRASDDPGPLADDDFSATLSAGLQSSGFDAALISRDPSVSQTSRSAADTDLDRVLSLARKPKKGKKGKKGQFVSDDFIESTQAQEPATDAVLEQEDELTNVPQTDTFHQPLPVAVVEPAKERVKDGQENLAVTEEALGLVRGIEKSSNSVADEDYWSYTARMKGKKGRKNQKGGFGVQEKDDLPIVQSPAIQNTSSILANQAPILETPAFESARETPNIETPTTETPAFATPLAQVPEHGVENETHAETHSLQAEDDFSAFLTKKKGKKGRRQAGLTGNDQAPTKPDLAVSDSWASVPDSSQDTERIEQQGEDAWGISMKKGRKGNKSGRRGPSGSELITPLGTSGTDTPVPVVVQGEPNADSGRGSKALSSDAQQELSQAEVASFAARRTDVEVPFTPEALPPESATDDDLSRSLETGTTNAVRLQPGWVFDQSTAAIDYFGANQIQEHPSPEIRGIKSRTTEAEGNTTASTYKDLKELPVVTESEAPKEAVQARFGPPIDDDVAVHSRSEEQAPTENVAEEAVKVSQSSVISTGSPGQQGKLAGLFPGLQRVKRRAPSIHQREPLPIEEPTLPWKRNKPTPVSPDNDSRPGEASQIYTHALGTDADVQSRTSTLEPPEQSTDGPTKEVGTIQDLPTVLHPTWGFPPNRDSAVHVSDSPLLPNTPAHDAIRDSGYQDAPNSPTLTEQDQSLQETAKVPSWSQAGGQRRDSEGTLRISVEVDPEWDVSIAQHQPSQNDHELSYSQHDSTDAFVLHQTADETHSLPLPDDASVKDVAPPSPVDSTTKDRTPYLFQSPSSKRELPSAPLFDSIHSDEVQEPVTALVAPPEGPAQHAEQPLVFGGGQEHSVDEPAIIDTPMNRLRSSSLQLDTIEEHNPESPLSKKSRAVLDVRAPELDDTSVRRSVTPEQSFRGRVQVSVVPITAATDPAANIQRTGTPKDPLSTDELISRLSWPAVNEEQESVGLERSWSREPSKRPQSAQRTPGVSADPWKRRASDYRSPSALSDRSAGSISKYRTPEHLRPLSANSSRSGTPPLRRVDRSLSGDLRAASKLGEAKARAQANIGIPVVASPSPYDRAIDGGKARAANMADIYEGVGDYPGSTRSPSRPPSVRKRQSMHIIDLEARLDQLASENRQLQDARTKAERGMQQATEQCEIDSRTISQATEAIQARDMAIRDKDTEIAEIKGMLQSLQREVARLTEVNENLTQANRNLSADTNDRYATVQADSAYAHQQWQESARALEELKQQHSQLSAGMEDVVRHEISNALEDRNTEIRRLHEELEVAMEQIRMLQQQILATKQGDSFLTVRDEDYFDSACQQLCQHVQQWVLRFSKFSDTRACRLSSEIADEKIEARLDNAILDGSDVDMLLADRVRRRDVFMSVVMTMIWEYVFTRYLFGMDREQRQKLKALEKTLTEVGPTRAVAQWRAITLTLLSKRAAFQQQRAQDTEAVVHEIYETLAALLPPPAHLQHPIKESLRNVMRLAVDLSIEMRTQRAEYIMLPPLQPEYDTNGDLVRKVHFNASLMNERSGETTSNEELEARGAVVKIVLYPLVVKKGDDLGEGEDEIVVCPAQVLVARPSTNKKVVRVLSGAMSMGDSRISRSQTSLVPESMDMGNVI